MVTKLNQADQSVYLLLVSSLLPLVECLGEFNVQTELLRHQCPEIRSLNWEQVLCFSSHLSVNHNRIAI